MLRIQTLFVLSFLLPLTTVQAEYQPQMALVTSEQAVVFSGPGEAFYATQQLEQGQQVEVYRVTPSGWCGIRPPDGSFSYVRADHVQATEIPQVMEVTAVSTTTRVGSLLHARHNVEYITLEAGEQLQRLSSPVGLENSPHRWFRVAPPAGEFRWMRRTDLRLANADVTVPTTDASPEAEPPATGEPTTTVDYLPPPSSPPPAPLTTQITEPSTIPSPATLESAPEGSFDQGLDAVVVSDSVPIADATLATASDQATAMPVTVRIENQSMSASHMQTMPIPAPGPYADPDNTLSVGDVRPTGKVPPDATARIAQAAAWKAVSKPAEPAEVSAEAMPSPPSMHGLLANATTPDVAEPTDPAREIVELELTLSQTVTQEIGEWQLRDLYQQAERLVQSTTDPAIQVQAKTLVERIRQFAELRQRHLQLSGQPPVTGEPISLASALTPTGQQSANDYSEQVRMPVDAQPPNQFPSASAMPSAATSYAPPNHQATPFAGQGWLVPVVTSRTDLPKFALTDDQGNVRQFVSAYPGLNLRRYQRQQVGIVGRQMAQPGQTTPHLIAERIVLLDRHRR